MTAQQRLKRLRGELHEHARNFEDPATYLDGVEDALRKMQRFEPTRPPLAWPDGHRDS